MSNSNWVCFECRCSKRQDNSRTDTPKCVSCKNDLYCIGYKVKIPKKSEIKKWEAIKKESFNRDISFLEKETIEQAKQKHEIEKEILRIEKLNDNKENRRLILNLKRCLLNF